VPKNKKRTFHSNLGFTLIEVVLAMTIGSLLALTSAGAFHWASQSTLRGREQIQGMRLAQTLQSRLEKMDFYQVMTPMKPTYDFATAFPLTLISTATNFGFEADYVVPTQAVLREIQNDVLKARFTHFTVDMEILRRDSADNNRNSGVMDLVEFDDGNRDGIDDMDNAVRFYDQNHDKKFYDAYQDPVTGKTISELPDTHIRRLTLKVWKGGRLIAQHAFLLVKEKLTGVENPSGESPLKFSLISPYNYVPFYTLDVPALAAARALSIQKPSRSTWFFRADSVVPMHPTGTTEPNAVIEVYTRNAGVLDPDTVLLPDDTSISDAYGSFSFNAPNATAKLKEGLNIITTRCVKGSLVSPYHPQEEVLDINPPEVLDQRPVNTVVATLSPVIACTLIDRPTPAADPAAPVSGLAGESTTFQFRRRGDRYIDYHLDNSNIPPASAPGQLREKVRSEDESSFLLLDKTTRLPLVLQQGETYDVHLEGSDLVLYKVIRDWSFTVAADMADRTLPDVSARAPLGIASGRRPTISFEIEDLESGLDASSLRVELSGPTPSTLLSGAAVAEAYDPLTSIVTCLPAQELAPGVYAVRVMARNWALASGSPAPEVASWHFTVH
jgi:prepilin-type N-terminal cleavage/methylation domain-containing protein